NTVPQLGFMRFPIKFVVLPIFVFPLLAGEGAKRVFHGFESSEAALIRWASSLALACVAGIAAILWFGRSHLLSNESWDVLLRSGASRIILLGLAFAALVALRKESFQKAAAIILLLLIPADALSHAPWQNPTVPNSVYEPGLTSAKMSAVPQVGLARAMMTR